MNLEHFFKDDCARRHCTLPAAAGATWNGTDQYQCAYTYTEGGSRSAKSERAAALAISRDGTRQRGNIGRGGGTKMVYGSAMRFRPEARPSAEKACREKSTDCVFMGCFRRK
jgi:hypothetical protein